MILTEEEFFKLKCGKLNKFDFILEYLNSLEVRWYLGLYSALYYLGNWQSLNKVYIVNTHFNKKIKFDNIQVILFKIPQSYFINKSIIHKNSISYSDYEKTYLDFVYFHIKGKIGHFQYDLDKLDFNTINLYLKVFNNEIREYLLITLDKKYLKNLE